MDDVALLISCLLLNPVCGGPRFPFIFFHSALCKSSSMHSLVIYCAVLPARKGRDPPLPICDGLPRFSALHVGLHGMARPRCRWAPATNASASVQRQHKNLGTMPWWAGRHSRWCNTTFTPISWASYCRRVLRQETCTAAHCGSLGMERVQAAAAVGKGAISWQTTHMMICALLPTSQ